MPPKSNQLTLDFEKLTERNLQPIIKKFKKAGYTVTKVDAPNKGKRESGFLIKSFTLTFEDEQTLLVRVKSGGVIFQVKLNKKVVPVKHVDDMDKAISEMCNFMYDNAKAYERVKKQRERQKIKPPAPSITTSRKEKIDKLTRDLELLNQNLASLDGEFAQNKAWVDEAEKTVAALREELEAEKRITADLEAEIEKLSREQGV